MRNLMMTSVLVLAATALTTGVSAETVKKSAKPAAKSTSKAPVKAAAAGAATGAGAAALSADQVALGQYVVTGRFPCAEGRSVSISPDPKVNGAFDVQFGGSKYDVVPMPTKSGALRLEDTKTGFVLMQLANKSMLFNEKQGRRLADDCVSPAQQAFADNMKANPTAGVLEGGK
jgi:hypothetical protein